ncbi:MAG: PEP-CTERM sorting domain-containing protein, partial [Chloroflexota bacterium]
VLQPQLDNISCTGNLTFSGASLSSDTWLMLSATEDLFLKNVFVSAPSVSLTSGATLDIDAGSIINAGNVNISAGTVVLNGQINSVPEPTTASLTMLGVGLVGGISMAKRRRPTSGSACYQRPLLRSEA